VGKHVPVREGDVPRLDVAGGMDEEGEGGEEVDEPGEGESLESRGQEFLPPSSFVQSP
jgi:hypothetical protein